jgi:alpha-L-fucosidase 2
MNKKQFVKSTVLSAMCLAMPAMVRAEGAESDPLAACNVVWDSPSRNSSGSMPIGNGDIGMNAWVEENGDLLLLIGKTDAWDENNRMLKVGRVRLTLSPSPFVKGHNFRQELKLRDGMIEIESKSHDQPFKVLLWVDANRPVIRVECEGPEPFDVTARTEVWRTEKRPFGGMEWESCWHMNGLDSANRPKEIECYLTPDTVVDGGGRVTWYHRNEYSVWPIGMKLQGLEPVMAKLKDPLIHRTFGAAMCGKGFAKIDANTLKSANPAKSHRVSIYPLTAQTPDPQAWLAQLDQAIQAADAVDLAKARAEHRQWWHDFWNRSWVRISGGGDAETVTRGYTLQRWMSACAGRGRMPIKFNGSIFTVERRNGDNATSDPDWRPWGGDYWYQNTRLPYWPMLAAGDYDLMRPFFNMYSDTLELAKARNRIWFNCEGAYATETMSFWGLMSNGDYGWNRSGKQPSDMINPYIRWIWSSGLELSMMMLDYYEHTQDARFLNEQLLPWADAMVLHFDTRFKRDATGKLVINPGQAVETYQSGVTNPTTDIAALRVVLHRLLALPPDQTDAVARQRWARFQQEIPEIPTVEREGRKFVLPAERFEGRSNCENPELYTVFPFRIYGVGKPDLEIGRNTFAARIEKAAYGWQQSSIQAAMLGLTDEAREMLVRNASSKDAGSRFPAFWGPNYDWTPDHCHGGNILNTTQTMLMQCEGKKILLFPAWPADWNVSFKLHAPFNTTVEGELHDGKVVSLKVTPPSRAADVVNMLDR